MAREDNRPDWLPGRFSWYLGERPRCPVAIREPLGRQDARQLIRLAHEAGQKLSGKMLNRLFTLGEWPCWLAVRNGRVIVGFAYGFTSPAKTTIKCVYVHPAHRGRGIEKRLITLLGLEVPECPTVFSTTLSNKYHADIFSDWKTSAIDERADTVTYCFHPIKRSDSSESFAPNS